jgi:hypothetical protein
MNWTTEFPTKPGYYWVKNMIWKTGALDPDPAVVRARSPLPPTLEPNRHIAFFLTGNDVRWDRQSITSAEWYGPIDPPE